MSAREAWDANTAGFGCERLFRRADIRPVNWLNAEECLKGEPLDMVKRHSVADDMGMDCLCAVVFDLVIALGRGLRG